MLKMRCKSCSKAIGVDSSLCGKRIKCPHCGAVSKVPQFRDAPPENVPVATVPLVEQPTEPAAPGPAQAVDMPAIAAPPSIQVSAAKPGGSKSARRASRQKRSAKPGLLLLGGSLVVLGAVGVLAYVTLGNKAVGPVAVRNQPQDPVAAAPVASGERSAIAQPESRPAQPSSPRIVEEFVESEETAADAATAPGGWPEEPAVEPMDEQAAPERSADSEMTPDASQQVPAASELPQAKLADAPPAPAVPATASSLNASGLSDDDESKLVELYANRTLFSVKEHPQLRRIFADRFARAHAAEIQAAWGTDDQAMQAWLEDNRVVKEELFLAIDPVVDDVARALQIFKSLKEKFPERIVAYANLAIAIAVTWDKPQTIYDFAQHQRRAKAVMPENSVDEIASFEYFVKVEPAMQGRAQWLPWEFLVHVVNHRTPLEERAWALQNYLPNRAMFGKCYQDVPYDDTMLETGSEQARLNGQPYTLANLRTSGGVCALQADFASRVGQSLGVPAAYVGGASAFGDLHAWVMWVEIKTVTPKSIVFTLESHGRYRGDKYYVGTLQDPKSGQRVTDRQLELRLQAVGIDPVAKRHADLVLAAYPTLKDKHALGISDQFAYLSRTIELCPGHEQAWLSLSEMATNETVQQKHRKQMTGILNQLFITFANFPDFTWTIFDKLIQYEDRLKERIKLYERLTLLYQAAQRPDLACEARLRLTDLLVEDGRELVAVDGLAATIYAFVDEGRYVPKMLDRIDSICQNLDGATPHLLRFYSSFLPRIPQMRGTRPSRYCMDMFERAIALFRQHGETAMAQTCEAQLAQIRAGQGRR